LNRSELRISQTHEATHLVPALNRHKQLARNSCARKRTGLLTSLSIISIVDPRVHMSVARAFNRSASVPFAAVQKQRNDCLDCVLEPHGFTLVALHPTHHTEQTFREHFKIEVRPYAALTASLAQ
jgi:hypothetical protein